MITPDRMNLFHKERFQGSFVAICQSIVEILDFWLTWLEGQQIFVVLMMMMMTPTMVVMITTVTLNLSSKTAPEGNDWSKSLLPIIQVLPDPETVVSISQILFTEYFEIFSQISGLIQNISRCFDSELTYLCTYQQIDSMHIFWPHWMFFVILPSPSGVSKESTTWSKDTTTSQPRRSSWEIWGLWIWWL